MAKEEVRNWNAELASTKQSNDKVIRINQRKK